MAFWVSFAYWDWGLAVSGCIKVPCGPGSSCMYFFWTDSTSCWRFRWCWGFWCLACSWVSSILFWVNWRPYFISSSEQCWAWLKFSVGPWLSVLGSVSTEDIQHNHRPGGFLALLVTVSPAGESASCTWMPGFSPWRLLRVKSRLVVVWGSQRPTSDTSNWCYSRPSLTDTMCRHSLNVPFCLAPMFSRWRVDAGNRTPNLHAGWWSTGILMGKLCLLLYSNK